MEFRSRLSNSFDCIHTHAHNTRRTSSTTQQSVMHLFHKPARFLLRIRFFIVLVVLVALYSSPQPSSHNRHPTPHVHHVRTLTLCHAHTVPEDCKNVTRQPDLAIFIFTGSVTITSLSLFIFALIRLYPAYAIPG